MSRILSEVSLFMPGRHRIARGLDVPNNKWLFGPTSAIAPVRRKAEAFIAQPKFPLCDQASLLEFLNKSEHLRPRFSGSLTR